MHRRTRASVAFLATLCAAPALAGERATQAETDQVMSGFYGNTSVCKASNTAGPLFECHVWFYRNGSLVQFSYDKRENAQDGGNTLSGFTVIPGTWLVERDDKGAFNLCRHVGEGPIRCMPQPARKIGDHWDLPHTSGGLAGVTEHFYIMKGQI